MIILAIWLVSFSPGVEFLCRPPLTMFSSAFRKQRDPQQFGRPIWATFQLCKGTKSENTQPCYSERRALCDPRSTANFHSIAAIYIRDRPPVSTCAISESRIKVAAKRKMQRQIIFFSQRHVFTPREFWRRGVACFFNVRTADVFCRSTQMKTRTPRSRSKVKLQKSRVTTCAHCEGYSFLFTLAQQVSSRGTGSPSFLHVPLTKITRRSKFPKLGKYFPLSIVKIKI